MPINQAGSLNTTALIVPDLYVQIVPSQNIVLNGVPTNVIGMVGTAQWGPINQPVIVATMSDYSRAFGSVQPRLYDMGTQVATAVVQGATNYRCVRVSDGSDTAATLAGTFGITVTARYTGTLGNAIQVSIQNGSAAGSWKVIVAPPGVLPEVYDNIPGPTAANSTAYTAFWGTVISALNSGNSVLRGPSQYVVASVPANTAPAVVAMTALAGGTDGASTVTSTTLIGSDASKSGMYALRNQGVSVAVLADATDPTLFTTQASFGLSEGIYMIACLASGTSIASAVSTKASAGLDSYAVKLMHGDWIFWNDPVNAVLRLVSPQGFVAGRLGNLSPERSPLNKPLYGVAGSQKAGLPGSGQAVSYSAAELQTLFAVGIDVIANPQPGGNYWGVRLGHNTASNAAVNGDTYTRMTNYLAGTLNSGMGVYLGENITNSIFQRVTATVNSYLNNLLTQNMLGSTDGTLPYSVICNIGNNPLSRTSLGYLQCDVQVRLLATVEKFILNLEAGQTVTVTRTTTPLGQLA